MAERARGRREGRLRAPARAAPPPAEPRARALSRRGWRATTPRLLTSACRSRRFSTPSYPAGRSGTSRSPVPTARDGSASPPSATAPPRSSARPGLYAASTRTSSSQARSRPRPRDGGRLDRARPRQHGARSHGRDANALASRRRGTVGVPSGGHARGGPLRSASLPPQGRRVSYTLRGRIESRLAATLAPLLAAAGLALAVRDWWPFALGLLMVVVGLALDAGPITAISAISRGGGASARIGRARRPHGAGVGVGDRGAAFRRAGALRRRLAPRAGSRSRGLPAPRLEYAEDGGELGRLGTCWSSSSCSSSSRRPAERRGRRSRRPSTSCRRARRPARARPLPGGRRCARHGGSGRHRHHVERRSRPRRRRRGRRARDHGRGRAGGITTSFSRTCHVRTP